MSSQSLSHYTLQISHKLDKILAGNNMAIGCQCGLACILNGLLHSALKSVKG